MSEENPALRAALELLHVPSRVHLARAARLPAGIPRLLLLAAGDQEALTEDAIQTGRSEGVLRRAALFYIEQVLLAPDADSYRILGADPSASAADLRRNMALLVRSLHPDTADGQPQSVYATRVTRAWETLKTHERRAAYETARRGDAKTACASHPQARSPRQTRRPAAPMPPARPGLVARAIRALLGPDVS